METLRRARVLLFGSAVILIALGVVMIYSASAIYAFEQMKDSLFFLKRHIVYLSIGIVLAVYMSSVDYKTSRKHAKSLLIVALVLLVLVLIPHVGSSTGGARRWFKFFGFSFQPSEFLKIVLIYYMADFLDRKKDSISDIKYTVFPALFVLGMCAGLIFLQPDLGTAITIALVTLIMFFAAGFKLSHLAVIICSALPALLVAMLAKPYRRKRILAFFHPWDDPRGVGLGKSQQKLFFLPESHTDFIFSIIGEELGFLGASSVIILFIVFIFAGMVIVFRSQNKFSQLFGLGLVSLIGLQAVINIGVSIGALPTKGLSLPFISYGGSALLANMAGLGLLINLSKEIPEEQ